MHRGLLLIERIIIESIMKKEKNIYELATDTGLDHALLLSLLPNLLMKNILKYYRGTYSIDLVNSSLILRELAQTNGPKFEVKEIFSAFINDYYKKEVAQEEKKTILKLQKIWLTPKESKELEQLFKRLEQFILEVKKETTSRSLLRKTHEQKVILWGSAAYSDLVGQVLESL